MRDEVERGGGGGKEKERERERGREFVKSLPRSLHPAISRQLGSAGFLLQFMLRFRAT